MTPLFGFCAGTAFRRTLFVFTIAGLFLIVGTIGAALQTMVGGDITLLTELCERTRTDAFEQMMSHAAALGANAVIGIRYDATEVMDGVTEVLCYGTAVTISRA